MTRTFKYNGLDLPDPDPTLSPDEVREWYADNNYPEMTKGYVQREEGEEVFAIKVSFGTKG